MWTRLADVGGRRVDLLHARIARRHYAPHVHAEVAVGTCTAGAETIRYRGRHHDTDPGSVLVLEPGEAHTGGPATPAGFTYRAFYLPAFDTGFPVAVIPDARLADGVRRVHRALSAGVEPLEADSRLTWLLAVLVRDHGGGPRQDEGRAAPVARAVIDRLADQLAHPPTLTEIATDLGLSRYQVLRGFRAEVGMPPYAWLAQHRVARARTLLDAGHRPAEVAAAVGFADQAHLTRWFRRVVGVTPGAYRNSVQDSARPRPRR